MISIGNISMGGTGKTPTVIELAKSLQQNYKVAILSRGYGRTTKGTYLVTDGNSRAKDWRTVGDEPALMSQKLSNVPIVVDEDRVRGGKYIVNAFNPDIIILDDAFQHRKIYRDIDIVLINASSNVSLNIFREPWHSLKRADFILITKGDNPKKPLYWKNKISKFSIPVFKSKQTVDNYFLDSQNNKFKIDVNSGKSALLFSGIADPQSFTNTVSSLGFKITDHVIFKDHHHYTNRDILEIKQKYSTSNSNIILTTEKDLIRVPNSDLPIYALPITMLISSALLKQVKDIL